MVKNYSRYTEKEIMDMAKQLAAEIFGSHTFILPKELEKVNRLVKQMIQESKKHLS